MCEQQSVVWSISPLEWWPYQHNHCKLRRWQVRVMWPRSSTSIECRDTAVTEGWRTGHKCGSHIPIRASPTSPVQHTGIIPNRCPWSCEPAQWWTFPLCIFDYSRRRARISSPAWFYSFHSRYPRQRVDPWGGPAPQPDRSPHSPLS